MCTEYTALGLSPFGIIRDDFKNKNGKKNDIMHLSYRCLLA